MNRGSIAAASLFEFLFRRIAPVPIVCRATGSGAHIGLWCAAGVRRATDQADITGSLKRHGQQMLSGARERFNGAITIR
ncbi:MAG TPA: hypothetical protein VES94_05700 [Burkholderiales bacterium]|nr:hypothetical protein [Burkholderiales bacterium]